MSWRIFQRWFNCPPKSDSEFITDERGEKYWIYWTTHLELGPALMVYYRSRWIGTIESMWADDGGLELADVIIFDLYSHLRKQGLGKAMLNCFIERAQALDAKYIRGFISPHQGSTSEYLNEWYKRQGFDVYEAKPGIYHILMKLNANMG